MKDLADIRKVNLNKIRKILWNGEWKTKQDISNETGLSVATCNTLLNELSKTKEVISERTRIHEVGPTALRYMINDDYEQILCLWLEQIGKKDILSIHLMTITGKELDQTYLSFDHLTPTILEDEIKRYLKEHSNISIIMAGIPGITENGVINHCDIQEFNQYPMIDQFTKKFKKQVYIENDMYFKAYGYYQNNKEDNKIISLVNLLSHILPGTATIHEGMIIKGKNQFAGMVGFLPFDISQKELLKKLEPRSCRKYISKMIATLIVTNNPSVIVITGNLLDEDSIEWIKEDCKQWIPEEYLPTFIYEKDINTYYLKGLYKQALQHKGEIE